MLERRVRLFQGRVVTRCTPDSVEGPAQEKERTARLWIQLTTIHSRCAAPIVMGWFCGLLVLLSGCGGSASIRSSGSATKGSTLQVSPGAVAFGNVSVGQKASAKISLSNSGSTEIQVSQITVAGTSLSVNGQANLPVSIAAGANYSVTVQFHPTVVGTSTGQLTIFSNSSNNPTVIDLSGTGVAQGSTLSELTCAKASMMGVGSDTCMVTLTAAAGTGGLTVNLTSNNASVAVPVSVTVPAGSTGAVFAATVAEVSSAETAILTGRAGGLARNYVLTLNAATAGLTLSASSVAFGDVAVNTPATQSLTLTSSGAASVIVNAATITGIGFSMSGVNFPITLGPSQTATLQIEFDPAAAGAATGQLTIVSKSSSNATALISLSGTGQAAPYEVQLTWNAPINSSDPVAGYEVYRGNKGSSSYQLLNSSIDVSTTYTDSTVVSGASYDYYVESIDASGNPSLPSNTFTVNMP